MAHASCTNGGCTKPIYRGTECFKCWAGTKWDSMKARVENRHGNYGPWEGKELGFSRRVFVAWAIMNPPPKTMKKPSVDRIDNRHGYTVTNIRWLEADQNSRGIRHDVPLTHRYCTQCQEIKPLTSEYFGVNNANHMGFQSYCIECRRAYNRRRHAASK